MPQTIRPDASTTRTSPAGVTSPGVFGQATMSGCMDEPHPAGADYTQCDAGSVGDVLVVGLGNPSPTPGHDYNHIVRVCASKSASGGASVGFVCELRMGYDSETENQSNTATLDEALDTSETVVTVTDGAQFAANDLIRIDSELMWVSSISVNDLTVIRGVEGTPAKEHLTAAVITVNDRGLLITRFHCSGLSDVVNDSIFRYRLTNAEAALITDYTDLQLRFLSTNARGGAPRSCRLHWAEVQLPTTGEAPADDQLTAVEERRQRLGQSITQFADKTVVASPSRI